MIEIPLKNKSEKHLKILCFGAHCDDIEIGCGGTLLSILENERTTEVNWIVLSSNQTRKREANSSANLFLNGARRKNVEINKFRNGYFPYIGKDIKYYFEKLKNRISPDIIFTHYRNDMHQDHRIVSELTWNTFRNHFILEYEILKYDGDLGAPIVFVPLEQKLYMKKIKIILGAFKSQSEKDWFNEENFLSIMRIRGMECHSITKYAEAFYCRKILLGI